VLNPWQFDAFVATNLIRRRILSARGSPIPTALLLATCLMIDHVGLTDRARQLRRAIDVVLNQENIRTRYLSGSASTSDYANAIMQRRLDSM
jgi:isocitrate dehydrogenase (NAD+)